MRAPGDLPARRLMIIVDEELMFGRKPVYREIVERAHRQRLAGASVFRGLEGFGPSGHIHTSRILDLADSLPIMIVIVDSAAAIDRFLPQLAELRLRGVVALDDVELVQSGRLSESARS